MHQCHHCEGFVPSSLTDCPHCKKSAKRKHRLKRVTQLVLGASMTMTLSACYGSPPSNIAPCVDPSDNPKTEQSADPSDSSSKAPCIASPVDSDEVIDASPTPEESK